MATTVLSRPALNIADVNERRDEHRHLAVAAHPAAAHEVGDQNETVRPT
ncbi:hypothetical protein [Streptomyces sp. NPDC057199]